MISKLAHKISHKLSLLYLKPIRVFVFHHVSDVMDPLMCGESDWTQLSVFKSNLQKMQNRFTFISLQEAIEHLKNNRIRLRNYAVLTADDGLRSTYEMLPWLSERKIPITLFICPKYLDGHSYIPIDEERVHAQYPDVDMSEVASRMFITPEQLQSIQSSLVTVASHGYIHLDVHSSSMEEFKKDVNLAKMVLLTHPLYKPFFAYTWGHHSTKTDEWLMQEGLVPVLCDGRMNYKWTGVISRECIDNVKI